jgi:peptidoglycan/LPS O-acetylase OafA/YrhL
MLAHQKELKIPSLDGIRGLAALTVFFSHAGMHEYVPGGFGVTVFFFLSGYLITTLLRREFEQSGTISFKNFYLRRALRILPPMYIVLTLALLLTLTGVLPGEMRLAAVLAQYAHLTNYFTILDFEHFVPTTNVMWSLAIEEHFYLLFPLALFAMLNKRWPYTKIARTFAVVCVLALLWRVYLVFELGVGHWYTYFGTDTRADSLLYGCIMGMWCNPALDSDPKPLSERTWKVLFCVGLALLLLGFVLRDEAFRESFRYTIQGLGLFPGFYCAVRFSRWPVFAWLQTRPVRAMGLISYTFYLCHVGILRLVELYVDVGMIGRAVLGLAGSIAFCTAMYFLVERRLSRWRKRLHKAALADTGQMPGEMPKAEPDRYVVARSAEASSAAIERG